MNKPAYSPHKISRDSLRPLNDWVLISDMQFTGRTLSSGIILLGDDGKANGIRPRWGCVYAVGPEQKDVEIGQYVLVAHGRWTRGIDIEDETGKHTVRRIDPKDILLISDEPKFDDTISEAIAA
jgi:co-chaperonin GroES (HSP10)